MRIVIKVGTNVLRGGTEGIHRPRLIDLARQIARLSELEHEPVLVSSGAVFAGQELLGVMPPKRKKYIPHRQMLAAVGQGRLLALYQQIFEMYSLKVAQALLTRGDLDNRNRYLNARNSMLLLLKHRVVPIINENDVVAVEEIKFGDNDNLSALVANLINADLLVILTDQKGLFTADPRRDDSAKLIPEVKTIDDTILAMATGGGHVGMGGMTTKLEAAQFATRSGTDVVIALGSEPDVILRVVEGQAIGTRFPTQLSHVESRKRWILTERVQGTIIVDSGAEKALVKSGTSLLAVGIVEVKGDFPRGATVSVLNINGQELGRGVANYKAPDLQVISGQQSHHIARILGYDYGATVIHRDDMVIQRFGE